MKKIILATVVIFFVSIATINIYIDKRGDPSVLSLLNIEAIASGENGGGQASCSCTKDCGNGITASCIGYQWCKCHSGSGSWYVECDGVRADC